MSRFKTLFAVLALTIVAPLTADAAPVTVRDNASDNGRSVFASGLGRSVKIKHDGWRGYVGAGPFSLQYGSDDQGWTDFLTFCVELTEFLSLPNDYQITVGSTYFPSEDDRQAIGATYKTFLNADPFSLTSTQGAAYQVVLWELVEDGAENFDLRSGSFEVLTHSVRRHAQAIWTRLLPGLTNGDYEGVQYHVLAGDNTQDLLLETPLPGALALLLSGIAGLGFASRKNKAA